MRMTKAEYEAIYAALFHCTARGEDFNELPLGKKKMLIAADNAMMMIDSRYRIEKYARKKGKV